MSNAITTLDHVPGTFVYNKYEMIDGAVVAQQTPRGRLCFRDSDGRMVLPRTLTEAKKAVFPVDWHAPLNPGPYFLGVGMNGTNIYPFSDGSLNAGENIFTIDPNVGFQAPWPAGVTEYPVSPKFYNLPLVSGNMCLVFDEGTFTYGSGNYMGVISDYTVGRPVYAEYANAGDYGKITASGSAAGNTIVGYVQYKEEFGPLTLTVKMKGLDALTT